MVALEYAYGRLLTASSKMVVVHYVELFPCNGQPTTTPNKGQCILYIWNERDFLRANLAVLSLSG